MRNWNRAVAFIAALALLAVVLPCAAEGKKPQKAPEAALDVLVLSNGDMLHGTLVSAMHGAVKFHSAVLGDVSLPWSKVKELRTAGAFVVVDKKDKLLNTRKLAQIPAGSLDVSNQTLTLHPVSGATPAPIPVKQAAYVLNQKTVTEMMRHKQGFLAGWSGTATGGASLVTATQNQYTVSGGVSLARVSPGVSWLEPRNRTTLDFNGSYGKITQPGYFDNGTYVAETVTKTAIYHADAERDEYVSPRFFALAQTAFDHNFGQDLALQQIYGGGMGWTAFKNHKQEMDLKATAQYEKQQFISGSSNTDQNLFGSTFSANYVLNLKLLTYTQGVAYIPAYTQPSAYSATETNTVAFPAYKRLSFSLGTTDSYLNNPPESIPPTKRNSFQFTMGLNYAFKLGN